ncbi:MAG: hypothetical protein ACON5A_02995 [Candidatus Comchoanobacterales bacterium]
MRDNSTLVSLVEELNKNNKIDIQSYNPPIPCLFKYFTEKQILAFINKHHVDIKVEDLYTHRQSSNNVLSIAHERDHLKAFVTAFNLFNIDTKNINIIKDQLTDIMKRNDIIKLMTPETKDAFLSLKDDKGNTPLHIAFSQGDFKTIELLTSGLTIKQIANRLTQKNKNELTPFNLAVKNFKFDKVKKILTRFDLKQQATLMHNSFHTAIDHHPVGEKPKYFEKNKTKTFKEVLKFFKDVEKSINKGNDKYKSEYGKLISDLNYWRNDFDGYIHDLLKNTNLEICYMFLEDVLQSVKVSNYVLYSFFTNRLDYSHSPKIMQYLNENKPDSDMYQSTRLSFMDRACIESSIDNKTDLPLKFIKFFQLLDQDEKIHISNLQRQAKLCNAIKYKFQKNNNKILSRCNQNIIKGFNPYLIELCQKQDEDTGNTLLHKFNITINNLLGPDITLNKEIVCIQNNKGETVLHNILSHQDLTNHKKDTIESIQILFKGLKKSQQFELLMTPDKQGHYCFHHAGITPDILHVLLDGQNKENIWRFLQAKNLKGPSLFHLGSINIESKIFQCLNRKQKIQVLSALDSKNRPAIEFVFRSLPKLDHQKAAEALIDISYDLLIQHKDYIIDQSDLPVWVECLYENMKPKDKTKFLKALNLDSTQLELSLSSIKTFIIGIDEKLKYNILKNNPNFVTKAIQNNHSATLKALLKDIDRKPINHLLKENPGWVSTAVDKSNSDILRTLLQGIFVENKSQLLKTHLDWVSTAIKNRNLDILGALFKDINPAIKTSLLKNNPDWVSIALKKKDLDVLKELFKDIDVQDKYNLIDDNPKLLIYLIINSNTEKIMNFLFENIDEDKIKALLKNHPNWLAKASQHNTKMFNFFLDYIDGKESMLLISLLNNAQYSRNLDKTLKEQQDYIEDNAKHSTFQDNKSVNDHSKRMREIEQFAKHTTSKDTTNFNDRSKQMREIETFAQYTIIDNDPLIRGLIDKMSDEDKLTFIKENRHLIIKEIKSNSILKNQLFEAISDKNIIHILNNDNVLNAAMNNGDFIIMRFLKSISTQENTQEDNILHKDDIQELLKMIIDKYPNNKNLERPNISFLLRHLNTDQTVRLLRAYHGFSSDTKVINTALKLDLVDAFYAALPKGSILLTILNRRDDTTILKLCLANDKKPFLSVLLKEIKTEGNDIPIIMKNLEKDIQKQLQANKKPNDSSNNSTAPWAQPILSKVTSLFQTDKVAIPSKLLTQIIDLALIEVLIPLPEKSALQAITTYQEYFTQDHIDDLDLLLTKLNDLPTHSDKQVSNTKSLFDKVASAFQQDPIVNAKNAIDSIKTRLSPGQSNKLGK